MTILGNRDFIAVAIVAVIGLLAMSALILISPATMMTLTQF